MSSGRFLAVVRPPGDSFSRAVSSHPERHLIDPGRAREQHAAYCALLRQAGAELIVLPPDDAYPDSCFTQDPAVVVDDRGLLARFGEASRRGEVELIEPVVSPRLRALDSVAAPATLEGGDVLRLGRRIVVGRSRRTNDAGIEALRRFAEPLGYEVRTAEVPSWALHLQTAATTAGDNVVLGVEEVVAQQAFADVDRIAVDDDDRGACNVVSLDHFVVAAGAHEIHRELERRGFQVHPTDLTEFERADGSPTCLSLLLDQ
jgi:dimethylargininase